MSKVAVIIVTYNPDINVLRKSIEELSKNNDIFVSDNFSENASNIKKICNKYKNTMLIQNHKNIGIGAAQNKVLQIILKKNYDYILFMDQDSFMLETTLNSLISDFTASNLKGIKIGSISPLIEKSSGTGEKFEMKQQVFSSGMVIPAAVLEKVGLMKEELFIDWIDYEWCWRARKLGYKIIQDNSCKMEHEIGVSKKIMGKIPGAPFRLYYSFRNIIILIKEKKTLPTETHMIKKNMLKLIVFQCVFCPDRLMRAKYIYKGIKDGKKNKLGKMKEKD